MKTYKFSINARQMGAIGTFSRVWFKVEAASMEDAADYAIDAAINHGYETRGGLCVYNPDYYSDINKPG